MEVLSPLIESAAFWIKIDAITKIIGYSIGLIIVLGVIGLAIYFISKTGRDED